MGIVRSGYESDTRGESEFAAGYADDAPHRHRFAELGKGLVWRPHALGVGTPAKTGEDPIPQLARLDMVSESVTEDRDMGLVLKAGITRLTKRVAES